MDKVLLFLQGKKTYLIAIAILIVTLLKDTYGIEVSESVWGALAAFGLGFLRAGVDKVKQIE